MKRTTEFVLGLIGGIFGFIGAFMALMIGGIDASFSSSGTSEIIGLGWGAVFLSILAIIGSVLVKSKPKLGGILLIISAVGGFICIFMFYILLYCPYYDRRYYGIGEKRQNEFYSRIIQERGLYQASFSSHDFTAQAILCMNQSAFAIH